MRWMRGSHSSEWRLSSTERGCTDGCLRILPLIRRVPRQFPPKGSLHKKSTLAGAFFFHFYSPRGAKKSSPGAVGVPKSGMPSASKVMRPT